MVFSETSQPHSVLKVVELDRLKSGKDQNAVPGGSLATSAMSGTLAAPEPSTSFSEVYLKSEPEFEESTMYHRSADCEFFQDLDLWCSAPAKEELVQTNIDLIKPTEEIVINTDTFNTLLPAEWDGFEVSSPPAASLYCGTPQLAPSPATELFSFEDKVHFQEKFLDISSLPVVIENFTEPHTFAHTQKPFIDQEDSLDAKLVAVQPQELGWGDVVLSEYIVDSAPAPAPALAPTTSTAPRLRLPWPPAATPAPIISTPEVLSYVEQLETKNPPSLTQTTLPQWPQEETTYFDLENSTSSAAPPYEPITPPPYEPITPKTESSGESSGESSSRRKRRRSASSDDSYSPCAEHKPRKYRRRKPSLPIQAMIQALEEARPAVAARRGRPPKRRDSAASSACSDTLDAPGGGGGGGGKYREIRDKNNEASKRSRMNRKLKELQMEQLAIELEERNKKLKVKADILEDMTKRLKDALMTAILKP